MTDAKALLAANRPAWAKALIVAELEHDISDSMTDYFNATTSKRVVLGWSLHKRDLFPELRKAAAIFAETADLATAPKSAEHREKWSMGGGYYIKAGSRYSNGWKVRKVDPSWWADRDGIDLSLLGIVDPAPGDALSANPALLALYTGPSSTGPALDTGANVPPVPAGTTVTRNASKNGVEIRFPAKPSAEVLAALKAAGWRWSRFGGLWYHRDDPVSRAFAESLVDAPLSEAA